MPAGSRAFAVSVLTATAALGAGICVMLLKVADLGAGAWRVLYVVPLPAIPVVLRARSPAPRDRALRRASDAAGRTRLGSARAAGDAWTAAACCCCRAPASCWRCSCCRPARS